MHINNKGFRLGARSYKTALAVFICLLIFQFNSETGGLYSAMTAFICMLPTHEESRVEGIGRTLATLIAFLAGFFVLLSYNLFPNHYRIVRIFIIPIVVLILIGICITIKFERSIVLCCTLFILLTLSNTFSLDNIVSYIVLRLVETIVGAIIALLINKYIHPFKPAPKKENEKEIAKDIPKEEIEI